MKYGDMNVVAWFIDGKLAGWQYAKREVIDRTTKEYPFRKEGDESNQYAWALRWATHGVDQIPTQVRTVEVIDINEWKPDIYEKYESPKQLTLEERVAKLEEKVK
jgi:hypothetical protein